MNTDIIIKKHNMRLETFEIVMKLIAHLVVGVFTPWTAALAQWANSEAWPPRIIWIGVILPASMVGGFSAVLAFMSGSYKTYLARRDAREQSLPETKP